MGNFDEYFPFDPGFGASANAARWRKMAHLWMSDGVLQGYTNQLNASAISGGSTTIATGAAFIYGYYCEIANPQSIAVGTNGTIVAKVDLVNEIASIYYKDGSTDYSGYEQDANAWEIPLWLVNGTALSDLRTMIAPVGSLEWFATSAGPVTVVSGTPYQGSFLTPRIPYKAAIRIDGTLLVTFSDASAAQSAACSLTFEYGQGDQQIGAAMTPAIPGSGPATVPVSVPVASSLLLTTAQVSQGKKTMGWRVSAGTGPQIQIANLTLSARMIQTPTLL